MVVFPHCLPLEPPQSHDCKRWYWFIRSHRENAALCCINKSYHILYSALQIGLQPRCWAAVLLILLPALVCSLLAVLTSALISLNFSAQRSSISVTLSCRAEGNNKYIVPQISILLNEEGGSAWTNYRWTDTQQGGSSWGGLRVNRFDLRLCVRTIKELCGNQQYYYGTTNFLCVLRYDSSLRGSCTHFQLLNINHEEAFYLMKTHYRNILQVFI